MAQPVVPTTNKLRIKLKGVPRVQQSAAAIYKGPAQAVRASLQLQDFRAAVDAFSKQGVHGLPGGMLLDPWNEEAELQAQQEINPTLTAVQYPPSAARVRKRRAPGPAEICLADLGPDYVVWGRHKRQRSEQPKRLAKSPTQLSSSLQRMLASSSQLRTNSTQQGPPGAAAAKGATPQQQQQQQRHSLVQIPPRPPSPCLDDPMEWQPPVPPASTSPAAAAPAQQERRAPEETKQRQQPSAVEQPPRPVPEQPSAAAVPQKREPQQLQGAPAAAPAAVESKQRQPQPAPPRKQPSAQQEELQPVPAADKQSPAQPCTAEPSVQQEQAQQSEYTDGIATRLRRRPAPEQSEPSPVQQSKQQKQAKGKQQPQKQRTEVLQDSGPPAKKVRAGQGALEPAAAAAAAPPAKAPAKSAGAKAAADAPKSAAPQAADKQVPVKAPAAPAKASRGKASAGKAAASPVKPAAAGKAGAAANAAPPSKDAAGKAAKEAQTAEAVAAAHAAEARGPAAAAAAVQAGKPESPPSETSHQQPIVAAVPQHLQLQPPLVPQLLQEQTAVSRDRSQCSLQQPVESPAAVASAGGRLGGTAAAAGAGPGGVARTAAGAGLAAAMRQPKRHLLELDASAMTPAALALGSLVVPPVTFRPLLPAKPFPNQEAATQHLDGMILEARNKKHSGDKRAQQERCWDVQSLTSYACSVLEFLRYWDACHKALKQLSEAGKPTELLRKRIHHMTKSNPGLLKQISQLSTNALQSASNCRGQDVQKQALRMLLERLTAICQLRHLHSQRESLSQHANTLKGAVPAASSSRPQQQQQPQGQRTGAGRPPVRASVAAAAAAAAGSSSPRGKQAFNKRSPDDSNTSHEDRVQMPHPLEQHSPGLLHHGSSPGAGGNGAAAGGGAGVERALIVAESTCAEHLSELLKVTDGMHQTVMRMQQFLESPDVLADANARSAALHISTLGVDAGMFSIPRVVAHAEAALVCIVRSGRLDMLRAAS